MVAERIGLSEVERRVCEITATQLDIPRDAISINDRLVEDLRCDSLELVELMMTIEEEFDVTLPTAEMPAAYKAVFTRQPFRLGDLAELIYLQQGGGPSRRSWRGVERVTPYRHKAPFTQLGGRWRPGDSGILFEPLHAEGQCRQYRRSTDGMRCVQLTAATVEIGSPAASACGCADSDESPLHLVDLDSFLMDAEPVSTTAYCRFLNSIGEIPAETQHEWFIPDADDRRREHMLIEVVAGD